MTTIEMARASHLDVYGLGKDRDKFVAVIERFAALVRADEREACEKACEGVGQHNIVTLCVAVIRARGETK